MIAYHAVDVDLDNAKGHARFARLMPAGPWAYKAHPAGGTLAYWQRSDPTPPALEVFGTPRKAAGDLVYYPPKPGMATLQGLPASDRPDCADVLLACGVTVKILPAYLAPRKILADGTVGDPVTEYGRAAWRVADLDRAALAAGQPFELLHPAVLALCRAALRTTYRLTDELIDDLDLLSTGDVDPIVEATWRPPKAPAVGA